MKKLLCTALILGNLIFSSAQTNIPLADGNISSVKSKLTFKNFKRNTDLNRAKLFTPDLLGKGQPIGKLTAAKAITADASIYTELWGEVTSVSHNEKMLFQLDYNYGTDAKISIKLLDEQINVVKSFSVALPESANSFAVLNEYFYDGEGKRNFMIYVHHFTGAGGPENQQDDIFIVTENGELRATLEGYSAKIVEAASGMRLMTFHDEESEMLISSYRLSDFSLDKSMPISFDLLNYMSGSPVNFMDVKGVPSLVLAHYKKRFMDNDTFEVYPDNNLMINIYDFDFNLKKSIALDISSAYPDEPYTIPMAEFGMFYDYGKYDITDKTFNNDDGIEILYGISYFDLMGDQEWNHYFVGNESGTRIKSLEQNIVGRSVLQELPEQEDQIGLYIGSDNAVSSINMFNIKSWTSAFEFPAYFNGELLSLNFNRVPSGNSYQYLFGMPQLEVVGNNSFGKINYYGADGDYKKTVKLFLGEHAMAFTPLLYSDALTPNLYYTDNQPVYTYASRHFSNGKGYNVFRVARNESDIVFETEGDTTKGNVVGSQYIKAVTGEIKKLALLYSTGNDYLTIDFHNLPFSVLKTDEGSIKNNLLVYVDRTSGTVSWNVPTQSYAVYSMSGNLVKQGVNSKSFSSAGLPKGVYILSVISAKGEKLTKRFIL